MKKQILLSTALIFTAVLLSAQASPGDEAIDFTLKNVDGKMVSLSDYSEEKGVILVFTCNPCPFSKAYEQRIIGLHEFFAQKGFPVVAINPNDEKASPDDTFEKMKERAEDRNYPFPYLKDETQEVYKAYGATRTPHVFLLDNENGTFKVAYIGAIDDNAMDEKSVTKRYIYSAIQALMEGNKPDPATTRAIGCTIK